MRSRLPGVGPALLVLGLVLELGACGFAPSGGSPDAVADDDSGPVDGMSADSATIDGAAIDGAIIDGATVDGAIIDGALIDARLIDAALIDAATDATTDAPTDASIDAMPTVVTFGAATAASSGGSDNMSFGLNVPVGSDRFLLVSVQLGTNCIAASPTVTSVAFNGVAMTRITSIVGTPCGVSTTRSEQWGLVAPAIGNHNVVVMLSGNANTMHSGAMAFLGVNQTTPVRDFMTASGVGTSSSVTVASAIGDLVANTVGQGNSVTAPGISQTMRYIHNVNSSNTLNNSGGSTASGAASVTMTWTFGASDQWQTISSSLQPAP